MLYHLFSSNTEKQQVISNTVKNLIYKPISTEDEISKLIDIASLNRSVDCSEFNSTSSRSHAIYQFSIKINISD